MEKKPHVCWIDIPFDNVERSKEFYSSLFGWQIEKDQKNVPDSPASNYYMIGNGENYLGGMIKRANPNQKTTVYISVESLDESMKHVDMLGGKVLTEKKVVPGWGYFAICEDTEKNTFALWEHHKEAK